MYYYGKFVVDYDILNLSIFFKNLFINICIQKCTLYKYIPTIYMRDDKRKRKIVGKRKPIFIITINKYKLFPNEFIETIHNNKQ